jgi:hypothetical protein
MGFITDTIEFIIDTLKGLILFVLYFAIVVVIVQYGACYTQIPYIDMAIVPGLICKARSGAVARVAPTVTPLLTPSVTPLVPEKDYKPMILSKINTSAKLVTTDKSVENLVFVVPNDARKNWDALTKNNKTWWDSLTSSIQNVDVFFNNLSDGRAITLRVSGKVYGNVDLEGIDATDITSEKSGNKRIYTVHTPASEILTVDVTPESIEVLDDDENALVGLMAALFKENDAFKTNTIKLSKQKILDKVCDGDFMKATADNAKSTLESLLSGVAGENRVVVDVSAGTCVLP